MLKLRNNHLLLFSHVMRNMIIGKDSRLRGKDIRYRIVIALLLLSGIITTNTLFSQSEYTLRFLPGEHQFRSLIANPQEARLGLWKFFTAEQMKVEMGGVLDLVTVKNHTHTLALGIEFFGYANVTGNNGLHLQIDALDGFFGGYFSLIPANEHSTISFRLRLLHHSAHLVDGNWWAHTFPRDWTKPGGPIPFTRDFGEIVAARHFDISNVSMRLYGGVSYATFFRPENIKRLAYLAGMEIHSSAITGTVMEKETNLFTATHISLMGIPDYTSSVQTKFGIKFGEWNSTGIILYVATNNGRNFFAEYLYENLSTYGMGFSIDFP